MSIKKTIFSQSEVSKSAIDKSYFIPLKNFSLRQMFNSANFPIFATVLNNF